MLRSMKLRINGYARHGKDTVGDLIQREYGLIKPDASRIIARWLVTTRLPKAWYAGSIEEQVEACYQDRVNHRAGWYNFVTDAGPDTLCSEVMRHGDIYIGERRRLSFEATKYMFDYSIWVIDPRKPDEPLDSCDLTSEGHDLILVNGGTLDDLEIEVVALMQHIMEKNNGSN